MTAQKEIRSMAAVSVSLVALLATVRPLTTASWDGGGGVGNPQWSVNANWVGDAAPGNPYASTILYETGGQAVTGVVDANWSVNALNVTPQTSYTGSLAHTIDLGGNRLTVTNELKMLYQIPASSGGDATLTFVNGTLQLGTSGNLANLLLARVHQSTRTESVATLQFGADATFVPYINRLELGVAEATSHEGMGRLDLRGVAIQNNTLAVNALRIANQDGWTVLPQYLSYLALDGGTNLDKLDIKQALAMATGIRTVARLGDPNGGWKLPAGVAIVLGVDASNRATVALASGTSNRAADAYLAASDGGTLTAYVDTLYAGRNEYSANLVGVKAGVLDFSAMDSCAVFANTIILGADAKGTSYQNPGQGTLKLPAGTLAAGAITLGDGLNSSTFGLLVLDGTAASVANSLKVAQKGELSLVVKGPESGLTLAPTATLEIEPGGALRVHFDAPGDAIRWEGDHVALLTDHLNHGRIVPTLAAALVAQGCVTEVRLSGGMTLFSGVLPKPTGTLMLLK